MKATKEEILKDLVQFHGSETIYKIPLIQTRYTEGMKYLANAAECFWLLTDVSIMAKGLMAKSYFITIDFRRLPEDRQDFTGYEAEII
jgi:hypothetical protein